MGGKTDRRLSAKERLKSKKAISRLFEKGRSGFVYPVRYIYLSERIEETDFSAPSGRILVSVPKRNHKRAVDRNLIKRRIREAYRNNKGLLRTKGGTFMLGLLYASNDTADYARTETAVTKILRNLSQTV